MKAKWIILIVILLTLCFAACNIFDDDYVWDDWATAQLFNK